MNDNLKAFPGLEEGYNMEGNYANVPHAGMTLRDYFAGQALISMMKELVNVEAMRSETVAQACYEMADAMIKERNK